MTRKGAVQEDWTTAEIAFLRDAAGRLSRREICFHLKKSHSSVEHQARREGLSLRCYKQALVWCNECASWRSYVNARTGRCKVCKMRIQLHGREVACAETMAIMTPEQRLVYEETESLRETREVPKRPVKQESCPVSRYQRKRAEERYLRALEAWEYKCLYLQYDAAKTRLRRMRKKTGTNPRKNNETSGDLHNRPC